jgi:hypothetical protein
VVSRFSAGELLAIESLGLGHIHDTFLVTVSSASTTARFVLQRFNARVFPDVEAVMDNLARVSAHARQHVLRRGSVEPERHALSLRRTRDHQVVARSEDGSLYRAFEYVAGAKSLEVVADARDAFEAGRAFGDFAALLRDLPAPPLHDTLPGFHDTKQRLLKLRAALRDDACGRARDVEPELSLIEAHASLADEAADLARAGDLPLRVTHNDAKLQNVLLDAQTGVALCVVDLDTVMPGYLAHDFGDLVRTTACVGGEDNRELTRVGLREDYFEALALGYLREVAGFLTPSEGESLLRGAHWIIFELAVRFLTDHVQGDSYFKIARTHHNLERARVQLQLLRELDRSRDLLQRAFDRARQLAVSQTRPPA